MNGQKRGNEPYFSKTIDFWENPEQTEHDFWTTLTWIDLAQFFDLGNYGNISPVWSIVGVFKPAV